LENSKNIVEKMEKSHEIKRFGYLETLEQRVAKLEEQLQENYFLVERTPTTNFRLENIEGRISVLEKK